MSAIDNLKAGLTSWVKMPVKAGGDGVLRSYMALADVLSTALVSYKYGVLGASGFPEEEGDPGQLFIAQDGSGCFVWIPAANAWAPIVGGQTGGGGPDLPGEYVPPWAGNSGWQGVPQEVLDLIQATADAAKVDADEAKAAAQEAQTAADAANAAIADIANPSKLAPAHKVAILYNYRCILEERKRIETDAKTYAILCDGYTKAVDDLDILLRGTGLNIGINDQEWVAATTDTDSQAIVRAFARVSIERGQVLEVFATLNSKLLTNLGAADFAASAIGDMGDDGVLTPAEKYAVLTAFKSYVSAKPDNDSKAKIIGVDASAYDDAIDSLVAYMKKIGLPITTRMNLLSRPNEFSVSPWAKSSDVTLTSGKEDPFGGTGATEIVITPPPPGPDDGTIVADRAPQYLKQVVDVTPATAYTFSFYESVATLNNSGLDGISTGYSIYDETNGAYLIAPTSYVTTRDTWERVKLSVFVPENCTQISVRIADTTEESKITVYGAQLEEGYIASPLISNETVAATSEIDWIEGQLAPLAASTLGTITRVPTGAATGPESAGTWSVNGYVNSFVGLIGLNTGTYDSAYDGPITGTLIGLVAPYSNYRVEVYSKTDEEYIQDPCTIAGNGLSYTCPRARAGTKIAKLIRVSDGKVLSDSRYNKSLDTTYRIDHYLVTDQPYLQYSTPAFADGTWGTQGNAQGSNGVWAAYLVRGFDNAVIAKTYPGDGLVRSYEIPSTDPDYGFLKGRCYVYDQSLAIIAAIASNASKPGLADRMVTGLIKAQDGNGAWKFSVDHETGVGADPYYRTGAIAWCAYALVYYVASGIGTKNAEATAAAHAALAYLRTLQVPTGTPGDFRAGLLKGGSGVYVNDVFQNTAITWASTEHNIDAWFAFDLAYRTIPGSYNYNTTADQIKASLLTTMWNSGSGCFYQGTDVAAKDTADPLDTNTWGSIFLRAVGDTAKATSALANAEYFLTTTDGADGYTPYIAARGYPGALPTVWSEGTFGAAYAYKVAGDHAKYASIIKQLYPLRDADGGWRYVLNPDLGLQLRDWKSVAGTGWGVIARSGNVPTFWAQSGVTYRGPWYDQMSEDVERDASLWLSQNTSVDGQEFRRVFEDAARESIILLSELSKTAKIRADMAALNAEIADNKATLAQAQADLAANSAALADNNAKLAQAAADLAQNAADSAANDAALAQGAADLAQNDATLALNNAALAQADATLALNNAALADNKAVLAQADATLALNNAALADNKAVLAQGDADLAQAAADTAQATANARALPDLSNVATGAVTTTLLADSAVSTLKLADNAVNANKIIAGAVTQSRLGPDVATTTFRQTWEAYNQSDWYKYQGNWTDVSIQNTGGSTGAKVLRVTGRVWLYWNQNIPFDPSRLYKLRTRFRQTQSPTSPPKTVYSGLTGVAEDGTTLVNSVGANSGSSQHYGPSGATLTTGAGWVEYTYYWKGYGVTNGSSGSTNPRTPGTLHPNVRYIRPLILMNYDVGDAIQECDLIELTVSTDAAELGGQLVGAQISDAAIDMAKFASGIRPPRVVSSLPLTPFTGYAVGDTVVLTTDQKLYRFTGSAFVKDIPTTDLTGTISTAQIAPNAIDMTRMASDIRPPRVVSALPTTPFTGYVAGDTVVLTTDNKLYRFIGTGFTSAVPAADLTGAITGAQIANGTITSDKVAFSTGGANKAPNSNFEFDTDLDGWADSWGAYAGVQAASQSIPTTGGYDNAKYQTFMADGVQQYPRMYMVNTRPFVRNGTHLTISAYMKATAGTQLIIGVKGFSADTGNAGETTYSIATPTTATGSWQRVVVYHTMTQDEYISMFPGMAGTPAAGTQLSVDCVQIEEGDIPTAYAPKPGEIMPGVVTSSMLADSAVTLTKFAAGLRPVRSVGSLPGSPYTGYVAGDTVVLTTDNKLYRFTGTGFTAALATTDLTGTITSGQIANNAVDATKLADGTVSASKLLSSGSVGSALNSNPQCDDITAYTGYASGAGAISIVTVTDGKVGNKAIRGVAGGWHLQEVKKFPIDPTKTYRLHMYARKDATADGSFYARVYFFKADGTAASSAYYQITAPVLTTTWQLVEGQISIPADAALAYAGPVLNWLGTLGYHEIQDLRVEEVVPGSLILDGAVAAAKLADGAVTAVKFGTTLGGGNLLRNSSFEIDTNADGIADGWALYSNTPDNGTTNPSPTITIQPSGGMYGGKFQRLTWAYPSVSTKGVSTQTGYTVGGKAAGILGGWRDNTWYTISWYAQASAGVQGRGMYLGWNNGPQTSVAVLNPNLSSSWQRYAYRVKWNAGSTMPGGSLWITISGTGAEGDLDIDAVQVEEGEVPTAYAPMSGEILPGAVSGTEIAPTAIDTTKIAAGAVTTQQLKVKKHYII